MIELYDEDYTIEVDRGDTGRITFEFEGDDAPTDDTVVLVSLQKIAGSPKYIWEKKLEVADSAAELNLAHEDTNLPKGDYCWGMRFVYSGGEVWTPKDLRECVFRVRDAVGKIPGDESDSGDESDGGETGADETDATDGETGTEGGEG